ncbi:hypothetical protein HELRODRAFT_142702, partial [Helobdella robusta]|uniref:Uncharacterized protein n=1 Tax=Helobdella robusta TaxID=6412 RepID=T1EJ69_HELRO
FAVPALLYCSNNNLAVHLQNYMDPATYQVLSNLKIVTTAVLYRIIIKRTMSNVQWLAIILLFIAGSDHTPDSTSSSSSSVLHITTTGVFGILIYCSVSGFSGVYCEYILKDKFEVSIHLQNTVLYSFGVILNFFTFVYYSLSDDFNLVRGFNIYVWLIIITQTFIGLIISMVMKHSSNITRLFIISSAAVVTAILSVIVFHMHLNAYFCISFVVFIVSLALY